MKDENLKETEEELVEETTEEAEEAVAESPEKDSKELEEMAQRLMRLQADFDNYKKRVEKERVSLIEYASAGLLEKLLPVIDNFDRAIANENKGEDSEGEGFYQGVVMIRNQLLEALESQGLEEIAALGESFDPNYHNAVSQIASEDHESNTVVEVYQKGYKLKDRVIRPSMVVVAS